MSTRVMPNPVIAGRGGHFALSRGTAPPVTWSYEDIARHILPHVDFDRNADRRIDVLEAGGGSASHLPLPPGARLTTIDISPEQLARNSYAAETLLGDLEVFDYGSRRYDLIIAWDVLEHLSRPEAALERFAGVLKPGGRLLVVGPLPRTLKGLVTRYSPHGLHVQFYRHVLGSTTAGQPGHAPFPTAHAAAADPARMAALLSAQGLRIDAMTAFESSHIAALRRRSRAALGLYRAAEGVLAAASLGRFMRGATDFFLVATSPGGPESATR